MGLVLAFAELAGAVLFLTAAITGATFAEVLSGQALLEYRREESQTQQAAASSSSSSSSSAPGASSSTVSAPTSASETAFITAVLHGLGAPATSANIKGMASWFHLESGSWPPAAQNNPWNTTEPGPAGTTSFNSVGVKNYPSALAGVEATVRVLNNGLYPDIIAALRSGQGLCGSGLAADFEKWSGGGYSSVC